jgi:AcrR family transcriptional regulator
VRTESGLRERKKQQTRQAIAAAAFDLFAAHGFDRVPVADVARRANVSEATVFNYFPTKEDLIYGQLEEFEATLIEAIRNRAPGQSATAAFRAFILRTHGLLTATDPGVRTRLASISRIIADSPSLLARERQVYDRYTRTLAELVAEQRAVKRDDIESWVVANAIMGVHRALVEYVRARVLAGKDGPGLERAVRAQAQRALDALDRGLRSYPDD